MAAAAAPRAAGLVHAAAARRLPRADQPAVVDAGAARPDRAHRARDRRRGDDRDQARLGVGGPRARPVPAHRRRGRRRPSLARVFADLRPGSPGRLHQHHAEAGRRGQGLALPRPRGAARRARSPRGRGGHLRAPRSAARAVPVHQRRQRHHPDHEHAARPRAPRCPRRRRAPALRAHARRRDLRRAAARAGPAPPGLSPARAGHRRDGPHGSRPISTSCAPTGASARRSSAGPPTCSTR